MSDDWIKMRCNLAEDPAVLGIASAVKLDRYSVTGRLHAVWSWADANTTDGWIPHATPGFLDEKAGRKGFAAAMAAVKPEPWLIVKPDGLLLPRFDKHNGSSAKSRAQAADRQREKRARDTVTKPEEVSRGQRDDSNAPIVIKDKKLSRPHRDSSVTRVRVRERSTTTTTEIVAGKQTITEADLPALIAAYPDIDIPAEFRAAKRKLAKEKNLPDPTFTAEWFVTRWLPNSPRRPAHPHALPPGFAAWFDQEYPSAAPEVRREYVEKCTLATLPTSMRRAFEKSTRAQ